MAHSTETLPPELEIVGGPSELDILFSFSRGQGVLFQFQGEEGKTFNCHPFVIEGLHYYDRRRRRISFRTLFPFAAGDTRGGTGVDGYYDLQTRQGNLATGATLPGSWDFYTLQPPENWRETPSATSFLVVE